MSWLGWIVVILAVLVAGWFVFDGLHALITGDYVTPKSGAHAGQLGPWSNIISAVGIAPRSTAMKYIFLIYGLIWLTVIAAYLSGQPWAGWAMIVAAALSLWYLPFGTLLGVIQIVILAYRQSAL